MIPMKLDNSIKLNSEDFSFSVPSELHQLVKTYTFVQDEKNFMLHVYPGDKVVVTVTHNGSAEILSNAKITKIDETSVDLEL